MQPCSRIYYYKVCHRSSWQPKTYVKPEAAITVFELLMMGGVSHEACWAIKKHWNNKFYYTVASCWFFLCKFKVSHHSGRQPKTYVKPEAAITVFSSLWWAMCPPKHIEQLRNIGIINSTTRLHLVGSFCEFYITMHGSMNIKLVSSLVYLSFTIDCKREWIFFFYKYLVAETFQYSSASHAIQYNVRPTEKQI
jgi:hypothetical protein